MIVSQKQIWMKTTFVLAFLCSPFRWANFRINQSEVWKRDESDEGSHFHRVTEQNERIEQKKKQEKGEKNR